MIKIGKYQDMRVVRFSAFGAYLTDLDESGEEVLLPKKFLDENSKEGMLVEVFVYKDTKDRLVASYEKPYVTLDELAVLTVTSVTEQGAFMDWGLGKDLFLPFREQTCTVVKGHSYLVGVYLDRSERLCATMQVSKYLREDSPYKTGDWVKGIVYGVNETFGVYVAVDNCFMGRIPNKELFEELRHGQEVEVRVTKVLEDGKLALSLREKSHVQRDEDSEVILAALNAGKGYLPLNDNSDPEEIKRYLKMSKKAFKRAIGKLYKEAVIELEEQGIRLK